MSLTKMSSDLMSGVALSGLGVTIVSLETRVVNHLCQLVFVAVIHHLDLVSNEMV